jgi:hypothetical protein
VWQMRVDRRHVPLASDSRLRVAQVHYLLFRHSVYFNDTEHPPGTAMDRRTRSGALLASWENISSLSVEGGYQICQTDVSLEELLAAAQDAADARVQAFEDAEAKPEDDESEWEDLDSCPPSPDVDSRAALPDSTLLSSFLSPPSTSCTSVAVSEDLPDPDMPALLGSCNRQVAQKVLYQKQQRQKKRQSLASSPFTCRGHRKSLPDHCMLPPHASNFDASNFETTHGGHWLRKRREATPKTKNKSKTRIPAQERWDSQRLRELGATGQIRLHVHLLGRKVSNHLNIFRIFAHLHVSQKSPAYLGSPWLHNHSVCWCTGESRMGQCRQESS